MMRWLTVLLLSGWYGIRADNRLIGVDEIGRFIDRLSKVQGLRPTNSIVPLSSTWEPQGACFETFYLGRTNATFYELPGSFTNAATAFQLIYQAYTRPMAFNLLTKSDTPLPENLAWSALALQALRKFPDIYEHAALTNKGIAQQIYFRDLPGKPSAFGNAFSFKVGDSEFRLSSTRSNLSVRVSTSANALSFSLHHRDQSGHFYLNRRAVAATNHLGQTLIITNLVFGGRKVLQSSFDIDYSEVNSQPAWLTAVEHGKYQLECNNEQYDLYFASEEEPVRLWLEHELTRGFRHWNAAISNAEPISTNNASLLRMAAEEWRTYLQASEPPGSP